VRRSEAPSPIAAFVLAAAGRPPGLARRDRTRAGQAHHGAALRVELKLGLRPEQPEQWHKLLLGRLNIAMPRCGPPLLERFLKALEHGNLEAHRLETSSRVIDCLAEGDADYLVLGHKSGACLDPAARFAGYLPQLAADADLVSSLGGKPASSLPSRKKVSRQAFARVNALQSRRRLFLAAQCA
jgi:hypothetical protein